MPIVKHLIETAAFSPLEGLRLCAVLLAILNLSGACLAQAQTKYSPIPEYKRVGQGTQTLMLIPCMSCRWNEWEEFMERNQAKYTMYAVTIPGYGGTPVPGLPKDTDRPLWQDNAVKALAQFLDEQKLREVTVVGHSWGTIIGVQLAAHRPDVIKRLIAYDTRHYVMFQRPRELDRVIGEYLNGNAVSDFKPPTTGAEDGAGEVAQIKKVLAGIIAADNASDVERIVAFYEDDALLLPPASPAVAGKAAIKERYRQSFENARLELAFHSEETQVAGAWAFDRGLTHGRNL